ncbi:MAG: hypothetical protein U0136_20140 [Bdellovibrionota bacterium]
MPMSYYIIAVSMALLALAQVVVGSRIGLKLWHYYDNGLKDVPPLGKTEDLGLWTPQVSRNSRRWMEPLHLWLIVGHGFVGLLLLVAGIALSFWYPSLAMASPGRTGPDYLVITTLFFVYVATVCAVSEFYRRKIVDWSKIVFHHRAEISGTYVLLYVTELRHLRFVNVPIGIVALGLACYSGAQIWLEG